MAFTLSSDIANTTHFNVTSSTSTTATLPTVNAGDFIHVWVTIAADPAVNAITVSDPTNGTYQKKLGLFHAGFSQGAQHFYFKNSAAATNLVVTASYSSIDFVAVYADAWAGVDTATGFDKESGQVQAAPGTGANLVTSTAATTTQADLILGSAMDVAGGLTLAAGTGFATNTNGDLTATVGARIENKVQGAAGSVAATFTDATNGGADTFLTLMMAVLPSGGAASQFPFDPRLNLVRF